jgi:hypothetical protein
MPGGNMTMSVASAKQEKSKVGDESLIKVALVIRSMSVLSMARSIWGGEAREKTALSMSGVVIVNVADTLGTETDRSEVEAPGRAPGELEVTTPPDKVNIITPIPEGGLMVSKTP